jgi:hypothetical protein
MLYFTCLRDPLDRLLSHFNYVKIWYPQFLRSNKNWSAKGIQKRTKAFPWASFVDFLNDSSRDEIETGEIENLPRLNHSIFPHTFGWSNFQTHMLTACGRSCNEESLSLATTRLEYFSAIIIIERWHESSPLLISKFGWKGVAEYHSKKHQNTHADARAELKDHKR